MNVMVRAGMLVLAALSAAPAVPAAAEHGGRLLVTDAEARQLGLERIWSAQVALDRSRSRLNHLVLHLSATRARTAYEIRCDKGTLVITQDDLDRFGEPLGPDGAKAAAEREAARLETAGLHPQVAEQVTPEMTLYAVSDRAVLEAIDAESGRSRWRRVVGDPDFPTTSVAVNETHLAVHNGSTLYLLDPRTGETLWQRRSRGVPSAAPAISDLLVFTPTFSGLVESHLLDEPARSPALYRFAGAVLAPPAVSPVSLAWTTDRGRLYVAHANRHGLRYYLETMGPIVAQPVFFGDHKMLVVSADGEMYCLEEMDGAVQWRWSAGESIVDPPAVIGDAVYVVTQRGSLFRLNASDGMERWRVDHVRQVAAASDRRLYCADDVGRLVVMNAEDGTWIGALPGRPDDLILCNVQTDRIIWATRTGMIQVLREIGRRWPLIHVSLGEQPAEPAEQEAAPLEEGAPATPAPAAPPAGPPSAEPNPFETPPGADPFSSPGPP